ncbi:DUF1751 family protein [Schizosaccharomyces japonicus yFS275]|uniref:DUF1751 family protein n=1 Tax=Schizosaccharomyces japonicus (strain yFS275 / FY16936) TaxID=402676 RepID=B6JZA0_SCHJY|nr:DUF1751 family protein [Schizosaccharomyces japonicus yFS275]EEB06868.2 DUF1751 family protein [Schizosaccharomyces japonicus yFS275]
MKEAITHVFLFLFVIGFFLRTCIHLYSMFTLYTSFHTYMLLCVNMVPKFLYMFPWTLLTCCFTENNVIFFSLCVVLLKLVGHHMEHLWSQRDVVLFLYSLSLLPNVFTLLTSYVAHVITDNDAIITSPIYGNGAFIIGLLIAWVYLKPAHRISISPSLSLPIQYAPFFYLAFAVAHCVTFSQYSRLVQIVFGFFYAWFYLLILQPVTFDLGIHSIELGKGSRRRISFYDFLPQPVQCFLKRTENRIKHFLFDERNNDKGLTETLPSFSVPKKDHRAEAERRRTAALHSLVN